MAALLLPALLMGAGVISATGIAGHRSIDKQAMADEQQIPEEEMLSLLVRLGGGKEQGCEGYDESNQGSR